MVCVVKTVNLNSPMLFKEDPIEDIYLLARSQLAARLVFL